MWSSYSDDVHTHKHTYTNTKEACTTTKTQTHRLGGDAASAPSVTLNTHTQTNKHKQLQIQNKRARTRKHELTGRVARRRRLHRWRWPTQRRLGRVAYPASTWRQLSRFTDSKRREKSVICEGSWVIFIVISRRFEKRKGKSVFFKFVEEFG